MKFRYLVVTLAAAAALTGCSGNDPAPAQQAERAAKPEPVATLYGPTPPADLGR